jgi:CxxC motif-containing protein (DUF1111 family)
MGLGVLFASLLIAGHVPAAEPDRAAVGALDLGRDLFAREWKPDDPRCHGGDGLGPVYNETSCVACHGQGSPGGAGPVGMNVEAITAVGGRLSAVKPDGPPAGIEGKDGSTVYRGILSADLPGMPFQMLHGIIDGRRPDLHLSLSTEDAGGRFRHGFVLVAEGRFLKSHRFIVHAVEGDDFLVVSCAQGSIRAKSFDLKPDEEALRKVHPGLVAAPTAMVHRYGVASRYETWRARLMAHVPAFQGGDRALVIPGAKIFASERNSPPLFGLGLIDALPDEVLLTTAEQEPLEVRGRPRRMPNGRVGRFGWKAQTAELREFVLAACASELGLEVPEHPQSIDPMAPEARAKATDLTSEECDALVAFVRSLPAPVRLAGSDSSAVEAGRRAFEEIGCTDCHRPSLGGIDGIYSDLLLHDMGPILVSVTTAAYYGPQLMSSPSLAEGTEWRTAPLWGYRDSGPYLHDGRAKNLFEAVEAHKGQSLESAERFIGLPYGTRKQIEQFLNSLAAPPAAPGTAVVKAEDPAAPRRSTLGSPTRRPATRRAPGPVRADSAVRVDPDRVTASRLGMARTLERMGKPEGALVFYREILRDQPDSEAARTAAARIKALSGEERTRKGP